MNSIACEQLARLRDRRLQFLMQPECVNRRLLREKMNYCWDILQHSRTGLKQESGLPRPASKPS